MFCICNVSLPSQLVQKLFLPLVFNTLTMILLIWFSYLCSVVVNSLPVPVAWYLSSTLDDLWLLHPEHFLIHSLSFPLLLGLNYTHFISLIWRELYVYTSMWTHTPCGCRIQSRTLGPLLPALLTYSERLCPFLPSFLSLFISLD